MIIESENILTVVGVILLAVAYAYNIGYVYDKQDADVTIPVLLNIGVTLFVCYGLFLQPKMDARVKLFFASLLVIMLIIEAHYISDKPLTIYGIPVAAIALSVGAMLKLYLLIALHCSVSADLSKSVLAMIGEKFKSRPKDKPVTKTESKEKESRPERLEPRPEPKVETRQDDFGRVNKDLLDRLKEDTSKTPEQKLDEVNKLRLQYGREAKTLDDMKFGGRRR